MSATRKDYAVLVAGSGPGGASVARELAKNGQKVLILEWGDYEPVRGTFLQALPQIFMPGKSFFITGQLMGMFRGVTTGGSSLFYSATAFDPPLEMLKSYGVDIHREVDEIRDEVPVAPLADERMSPAGMRFLKSALDLGYDAKKLNKFIFQDKCRKNCDRCMFGCPIGAKWTARNWIDDALADGAEMINFAKVDRVIIEKGRTIGLRYTRNGRPHNVYAPTVVVAAGGIGSPLILRNSGIDGVGHNFFFDPLWFVYGTVQDGGSGKGAQMCAGIHFEEDGIILTDFNLDPKVKAILDGQVLRFDQTVNFANVVPIMIKVRDGLGGRITDSGWVWKSLEASDKYKLRTGRKHARRILENMGARDIYISWLIASHPGGSVKIGEHLNDQLQTRIENLYVCDCSVIPEELGLPPTLTLLALGKRLAKHLLVE